MIEAQKLLGVDLMTGHWEFTYGEKRVQEAVKSLAPIEFLAQNVKTADFNDPVFKPYVLREMNGVPVAVIGQAFPYTPIANPRHFVADWTFGIQETELQKIVDEVRAKGVRAVVLLSHNGMDVDLKLASRVTGIDVILGGHTHDAVPKPVEVANPLGKTLVTNAGSNGKYLGVLDLDVRDGRLREARYRLLPVFSSLLPADSEMANHISKARAPYLDKLGENLATSSGMLYRRGNFNGTVDQLILDALMSVKGAQIAFSPGFRWGTTLLPGQVITTEQVMDWTSITYPYTTLSDLSGEMIKTILEDVCDNLFNPDPYYQQGGDMVRVAGMTYTCTPGEAMGKRISDMRLHGKPIEASKTYKVAGWAPVAEGASGQPIWEVVTQYLKSRKTIAAPKLSLPKLVGVEGNPGIQ
jgi:sulfur-oxidizing protein SoxB